MAVANPYGEKVVKRERIELGGGVTLFRKTWDNGYIDIYARPPMPRELGVKRSRRKITQAEWDAAAATRKVHDGDVDPVLG